MKFAGTPFIDVVVGGPFGGGVFTFGATIVGDFVGGRPGGGSFFMAFGAVWTFASTANSTGVCTLSVEEPAVVLGTGSTSTCPEGLAMSVGASTAQGMDA